MEKVCKNCKLIISQGEACPICGGNALTNKGSGYVCILDAERSEVAKKLGYKVNGTYAMSVS